MIQKWKFVWEWDGEFESVSSKEEDEQSEMFEGKLKRFKNWPILCKTRDFRDWNNSRSCHQGQPPNTWKKTFEKIFQVFFATGSSTRERIANWIAKISVYPSRLDLPPANKSPTWAAKSIKFQNFDKYSKSFTWLKHLPANESPLSREKSLLWTRNWGIRLVLPATESPE